MLCTWSTTIQLFTNPGTITLSSQSMLIFSNCLYKTVEFGGREKDTFMQSCASLTRKDGVILKMICFLDHSGQEFMPCCTSVIKRDSWKISIHFSYLLASTQSILLTQAILFWRSTFSDLSEPGLPCSEFSKYSLVRYLF